MSTDLKSLQKGKCKEYGLIFKDGDILDIDHILPKKLSSNDTSENKQLLYKHCKK